MRGRYRQVNLALAAWALWAGAGAGCDRSAPPAPLLVYVGGTMRPAMEELAAHYQRATGVAVRLDYGDSGACVLKIQTTGQGDLCVVHDPFGGLLLRKGLASRNWTVATLTPTLVVPAGNPKGLTGLADLARPDVRVVLTDATYSTLGHIAPILFEKAGIAAAMAGKEIATMRSGGEAANAVVLGHADAALVWNAVAALRSDKLTALPIPAAMLPTDLDAVTTATYGRLEMNRVAVTVSLLSASRQGPQAEAFAEFLAGPVGREVFAREGFTVAAAASAPASALTGKRIRVYAAAGLREALDAAAAAFTRRSGATVELDYGGSGVLLSRLKLAGEGDVFIPGDDDYMHAARQAGLVEASRAVAYLQPVLVVAEGNPKGIAALSDLARPGLRVALGRADACQIGRASEDLLTRNGIDRAAVAANTVFQAGTVNELAIPVRLGHADVAIVWDAIAAQHADGTDAVAIPPAQNVFSPVPAALLRAARSRAAAEEFLGFLAGPEGRAIFAAHHYRTAPPE